VPPIDDGTGHRPTHRQRHGSRRSVGAYDIGYFVSHSTPPALRREIEFDLLRAYYRQVRLGRWMRSSAKCQNHITPLNFLSSAEEAAAFDNRNYVGLHQSTLSKVDNTSNLFQRACDRQLKTTTTWWEMHGDG
jgi:hypothetical protein